MSNDRLAASRAKRLQAHEMSNLNPQTTDNGQDNSSLSAFFSEITSIQNAIEQINLNVTKISALHARLMNVIGQDQDQAAEQLDHLTEETRALSNSLKDRIKALESSTPGQDSRIRKNQTALVRSKFLESIQNYQRAEQDYRSKSRQRIVRQLKIVKPDATPEEIVTVVEGGGQQIFSQLPNTGAYEDSKMAYREVQQRQQDLKKMEQTLAELAQLFTDMGTLVEQQDETINDIGNVAKGVEEDTEKAAEHTQTAVKHARNYRKKRWICFFITIALLVILAIILAAVFGSRK